MTVFCYMLLAFLAYLLCATSKEYHMTYDELTLDILGKMYDDGAFDSDDYRDRV